MNKLIGYCGLNCEKCDAYIATKTNDNDLRKKTAKLWSELNNFEITPEMINCTGCRTEGPKTYFCDNMCEIKKCSSKKKFDTCGDCSKLSICKIVEEIHINSADALNNLKTKKQVE